MSISKLQTDFDVSFLSAFKTPAKSRYFFDITDRDATEDLFDIISFSRIQKLSFSIIAWGTNCLFAFDMYEWIIIRNRYAGWEQPIQNGDHFRVRVHSGESVNFVAMKLYDHHKIATLIPWIGLPGTFGGATVGNAGCFGLEMSDIFIECEALDLATGEIVTLRKDDMKFAYRESALKHTARYFVLSTLIDVAPRWVEYESYTPETLRIARKAKQPAGFSCGSFFKNPPGVSAWKLIDDAGLKGTRIGWVKISEQHGNFFLNDEKAKWQDIIELRNLVKDTILAKYGIPLQEEVRIITNEP